MFYFPRTGDFFPAWTGQAEVREISRYSNTSSHLLYNSFGAILMTYQKFPLPASGESLVSAGERHAL